MLNEVVQCEECVSQRMEWMPFVVVVVQEGDDEAVWWWRQREIDLCEMDSGGKTEGLGDALEMMVIE